MQKFLRWITHHNFILALFITIAFIASAQSLFLGQKKYLAGGIEYNVYNNYTIFKQSFYHLLNGKDLYFPYPMEHWDIYKYSPTFSLLFGGFALLPDMAGVTLWNLLNSLILLLAVYYLPKLTLQQKGFILLACVMESMTAMQNEQSNGLMAGLIILAFGLCERNKLFAAALCIVLTAYIKIFGVVAFAIFLFYPDKWKAILYSVFWTFLLFLLPLLVIDLYQLKFLYKSWGHMLSQDHSLSLGLSVIGWLESWFGIHANKIVVALSGAVLFLIPLVRFKQFANYNFRLLTLASVLIWMVIFNHKAESPTFIIAMAGIGIWYFTTPKSILNTVLFWIAIVLTSVSTTDIFPVFLRKEFVEPYVLKAVPSILIWIKILWDMIMMKRENV